MLVAHLSAAASVTRATPGPRPALTAFTIALSPPVHQGQIRHFCRSRKHYEASSDPEYAAFHRKRQQRVRAALRDALKRRSRWQVPVSFTNLFGARQASHWSKTFKRWPQLEEELRKNGHKGRGPRDDYELSPGEKRWRKHMQAVKDLANIDPYHAVFGRPFDPFWSPSLWGFSPKDKSSTTQADASSNTFTSPGSTRPKPYTETSSFSYSSWKEPGKAPIIEATSSKWDSASNTATNFRFDPISNRMIPDTGRQKDSVEGLTADSIRASMGNFGDPTSSTISEASQSRINALTKDYERRSTAVDHQIDEARQELHGSHDGYSSKPTGMQQSFSDEIRASASSGKTPLEESLRNTVESEVSDGYSKAPKGLQTSFTGEKTSLADDLSAKTSPEPVDDGYSQNPTGMQTSFSGEKTPLAEDLSGRTRSEDVDDGYRRTPTGMQTSFKDEKAPLDSELLDNTKAKEVDDGYSKAPTGMQTSFTTEKVPLSSDLVERLKTTEVDDGYSKAPVGMQTSYTVEQQACEDESQLPLHKELASNHIAAEVEDGYSKDPVGMQTSYTSEQETHDDSAQTVLEREFNERLIAKDIDDGYSKDPVGMQTSYTSEQETHDEGAQTVLEREFHDRLIAKEIDDGYSKDPIGMQTSYVDEHKDHADTAHTALEEELQNRLSEDPNVDDGYSNQPMGMQTNYTSEQHDVEEQKRVPFHEEIQSMHEDVPVDDGYSNQPIGLQKAYLLEQEDVSNHDRPSLAEEIELNMKLALDQQILKVDELAENATSKGLDLEKELESARLMIKALEEQLKLAMFNSKNMELELKAERSSEAWKDDTADIPDGLQILTEQKQRVAEQELLDSEAESQKATRAYDRAAFQSNLNGTVPGGRRPFHAAPAADRPVQGEGDMSRDVVKFANNDRWYKQMHTSAASSGGLSNDQLVQDIVKICKENELLQPHDELLKLEQRLLSRVRSLEESLEAQKGTQETTTVQWAEPASYKILAYDASNDAIQTVTTTSRFSETESPISVASAMSKVHEPAQFVSHFARFQKDGYQAIHASDSVLVLRKTQHKPAATEGQPEVNPVDGTVARQTETATGNFASPTGFVNHDPLFPPDDAAGQARTSAEVQDGIYYRRVRRQEPVFSGRQRDGGQRYYHRRERPWKRRVRFAAGVGVTSAVLVYALGVGAELAKGDKQQKR